MLDKKTKENLDRAMWDMKQAEVLFWKKDMLKDE